METLQLAKEGEKKRNDFHSWQVQKWNAPWGPGIQVLSVLLFPISPFFVGLPLYRVGHSSVWPWAY